jgi:G3E family GTPase
MVPVVVLTGFLGSGKTTLLNRLIARGGRVAIVVNELGAVGVDGALLPAGAATQVELPGGCICCTLNEDLDKTIVELLQKFPDVERVVIETTGVAEPLPISWAMERKPLVDVVRLAAVVTLVDVENFLAERAVSPAVDAQVAYADVVVMTKTDLRKDWQDVRDAVAALAPKARQMTVEEALDLITDAEIERIGHGHGHGHGHVDHGIDAVVVEVDGEVDVEELGDQLAELGGEFVRIKGIVRGEDGWWAIHRVGLRVSMERLPTAERGVLVGLGAGVTREPLARAVVSSKR